MNMKSSRCPYEKKPGVLIDHLEGILDHREEDALHRHLAECPRCAAELAAYADLLAVARSGPEPIPPPGTAERLMEGIRRELAVAREPAPRRGFWRLGLIAAAPALAVVVLLVARMSLHEPLSPSSNSAAPTASAPSAAATTPAAATPAPGAAETMPDGAAQTAPLKQPELAASDIASNPALDNAIASVERDEMREYGDDVAADSMGTGEEQAFSRLLKDEIQVLMHKHEATGQRSSLGHSGEEYS